MAVRGVRGVRLGLVLQLHEECFEVKPLKRDDDPICIKAEAIFTVDKRDGVSLVCSPEDVGRYTHPMHSSG